MGWNPIFIPEGQDLTIAEMSENQLEQFTPRGRAVQELKTFLES
jgi:inosine/xanthosine triphosphate pyrophosphatase family protein